MIDLSHKKIVYLGHDESRLISAIYSLAGNGLYYCIYKKYFDSLVEKFKNDPHLYIWHKHTLNAYYDLAITNWCKIFGAYSEPTHYQRMVNSNLATKFVEIDINPPNKEILKAILLKNAGLSEPEFNEYQGLTTEYRNRNLIHREHSPDEINDGDLIYPDLHIATETFLSLLLILIEVAKKYPTIKDQLNRYELIYDDFSDKNKIRELIKKSLPKFIETL